MKLLLLALVLTTGCTSIKDILPLATNYELISNSSKAYVELMKERIEKCKRLADKGRECTEAEMAMLK